MTEIELLAAVAGGSVTTGGVSALAVVKALGVHISYINKRQDEQERAIKRAHERITESERRGNDRAQKIEDRVDECRLTITRLHPGETV